MNGGFGKDLYRKGNSVKRSGPFSELPDSENRKVAVLIPFPKNSSFAQSFSTTHRVMDVCAKKSRTSAPKSAFSCGRGGGEKPFDPWASGRKGQECPREIRTKKFMFMLFFLP